MRLALLLVLALATSARAESYQVTVDGSQVTPPTGSQCVGTGTLTLSEDETILSYEIHFTNWVNDEFAAHIHELNFPPQTGEHIVDDIAMGPDKIGSIPLGPGDVVALRAQMMFVMVHTNRLPSGAVKGWILPAVPAFPTTWGEIKSLYR